MLSRTAENLFWLARYMERAETMARLLEVGARITLLPDTTGGYRSEWDSILQASGTAQSFAAKYSDAVERNIVTHMFFDTDNSSSVASCIGRARENARIVRTALTAPVWDALNGAYQEVAQIARQPRSEVEVTALVDWTARQTAAVHGAAATTLLRNDGYDFLHLGYHLERADNTARLLDVKYYVLLPDAGYVGSGLDNYQWTTLLRVMQMQRSFHWAYGGDITPAKIADLLILNRQCPRSLLSCVEGASGHLDRLARSYGRSTAAQSRARGMVGDLAELQISTIFEQGLHEFLSDFVDQVGGLGGLVHESYLRGVMR